MIRMALIFVCILSLVGCEEEPALTRAHFDDVQMGMALAETEAILGEGAVDLSQTATVQRSGVEAQVREWRDGGKRITITFVNGKVASKSQKGL